MCEREIELEVEGYKQWLVGNKADQSTTVFVEVNGQQIIELAYVIKDLNEASEKQRLSFEQANCYASTSRFVGDLLGQVCLLYLAQHPELSDFYNYGGRMDLLGEAP